MLDKIKGLGSHVATKTGDAVDGVTASVKQGVDSLSITAANLTDALNDKAVRVSTAQACSILEIAMEELKGRPLSGRPVCLTATVNFGIASLEMQVQLPASDDDGGAAAHPG